jgi:hypothetical protein
MSMRTTNRISKIGYPVFRFSRVHSQSHVLYVKKGPELPKCVFLQSSLRVNTGAICAFGRSYIAAGFKEFSLNWTYN